MRFLLTGYQTTTGGLVLASNVSLARELSRQFQTRSVEKTYLALVRGGEKSFSDRKGEIRAPLQFNDGRVSLGNPSDKMAETHWELVSSSVSTAMIDANSIIERSPPGEGSSLLGADEPPYWPETPTSGASGPRLTMCDRLQPFSLQVNLHQNSANPRG